MCDYIRIGYCVVSFTLLFRGSSVTFPSRSGRRAVKCVFMLPCFVCDIEVTIITIKP